jgi:hypothetical protein
MFFHWNKSCLNSDDSIDRRPGVAPSALYLGVVMGINRGMFLSIDEYFHKGKAHSRHTIIENLGLLIFTMEKLSLVDPFNEKVMGFWEREILFSGPLWDMMRHQPCLWEFLQRTFDQVEFTITSLFTQFVSCLESIQSLDITYIRIVMSFSLVAPRLVATAFSFVQRLPRFTRVYLWGLSSF